MTSLLDIGPVTKTVKVRGKEIEVSGITLAMLLDLLASEPELRKLFGGGNAPPPNWQTLLAQFPDCVATVIAAATGAPNDKKAIETARKLGLGEQAALLSAIWELTFPDGIDAFMAALAQLTGEAGLAELTIGKVRATITPEQSSNSSPPGTDQTTFGNTHQGN